MTGEIVIDLFGISPIRVTPNLAENGAAIAVEGGGQAARVAITQETLSFGITDHGALTGLGDNDHPQYLLASSTDYVHTGSTDYVAAGSTDYVLAGSTDYVLTGSTDYVASGDTDWLDLIGGGEITLHSHAGGAGGRTQIGSDVTPAGAAVATFSTIPGTYKELIIEGFIKSTYNTTVLDGRIEFNSDTSSSDYYYSAELIYTDGTAQLTASAGADCFCAQSGVIASGAGVPANEFTHILIRIPNYANSTPNKVAFTEHAGMDSAASLSHGYTRTWWNNNAAITQIDIRISGGNFATGSLLRLYGEN